MRYIGYIALLSVMVMLMGCGWTYGEKYDGLLVQDGDGNVYKLKHRLLDVYFIQIQNQDENGAHDEANKKLIEKAKEESE